MVEFVPPTSHSPRAEARVSGHDAHGNVWSVSGRGSREHSEIASYWGAVEGTLRTLRAGFCRGVDMPSLCCVLFQSVLYWHWHSSSCLATAAKSDCLDAFPPLGMIYTPNPCGVQLCFLTHPLSAVCALLFVPQVSAADNFAPLRHSIGGHGLRLGMRAPCPVRDAKVQMCDSLEAGQALDFWDLREADMAEATWSLDRSRGLGCRRANGAHLRRRRSCRVLATNLSRPATGRSNFAISSHDFAMLQCLLFGPHAVGAPCVHCAAAPLIPGQGCAVSHAEDLQQHGWLNSCTASEGSKENAHHWAWTVPVRVERCASLGRSARAVSLLPHEARGSG